MAQRNQPVRPATKAKPATGSTGDTPPRKPANRPPARKPGKSIVNQKQTPWGLIAITVVLVLFAGAIVAFAVKSGNDKSNSSQSTSSGEKKDVKAASATKEQILADLPGITVKTFTGADHKEGIIDYGADSPPFGGPHNQNWAECTGVVYSKQIANENAVHTLEHGAVWVTYNPDLPKADVDKLAAKVSGYNYTLMTPYAGLKKPISLQSWGYQMFFDSADDPKIDTFLKDLRLNPNTIPEYGASCDNPKFVASDSYPGHPASLA